MINPIDSIRNMHTVEDFEFFMGSSKICPSCHKPKFKCPYCGTYFCREDECEESDPEHINACREQNKV